MTKLEPRSRPTITGPRSKTKTCEAPPSRDSATEITRGFAIPSVTVADPGTGRTIVKPISPSRAPDSHDSHEPCVGALACRDDSVEVRALGGRVASGGRVRR